MIQEHFFQEIMKKNDWQSGKLPVDKKQFTRQEGNNSIRERKGGKGGGDMGISHFETEISSNADRRKEAQQTKAK